MRNFWIQLPVLLVCLLVSGCQMDQKPLPDAGLEKPEYQELADDVVDDIVARDVDAVIAAFGELEGTEDAEKLKQFEAKLPSVLAELPSGDLNTHLVYSEKRWATEARKQAGFLAQYEVGNSEGGFAVTSVVFLPQNEECCVLTWLRVEKVEQRPSTANDFTFDGKGFTHYLVALLLVTLPVLCITTAIFCGFNKKVRRKYLWIPFILVGLWGFDFNWSTGQFVFELFNVQNGTLSFKLFTVHLLSAAIVKWGYFSPWIITIGSPVGAVCYWVLGRHGRKSDQPEQF